MSDENARRLVKILRDAGCKPQEPIALAQVQAWAVQNGFADLLEDALGAAGERGGIEDNHDPNDGQMRLTPAGWENGNA